MTRERGKSLIFLRRVVANCSQEFCTATFASDPGTDYESWNVLSTLLLFGALKCMEHADHELLVGDCTGTQNLVTNLYTDVLNFCPAALRTRLSAYSSPTPSSELVTYIQRNFNSKRLSELWSSSGNLGYIYQFFSIPARKAAQSSIQSSNKDINWEKLIRFTQLYTPEWIAKFLLVNTILPQWKSPPKIQHGLDSHKKWLVGLDNQSLETQKSASELTVLDPACGSAHILSHAFHLLTDLHLAEGRSLDDAVKLTISQNLAGADIDPIALFVSALVLFTASTIRGVKPDFQFDNLVCALDNESSSEIGLGSLSRVWSSQSAHPLSRKYAAVVTNPPYIGRKLLSREFKSQIKRDYPEVHHDVCAAFLIRGLEMLASEGRLGFITQSSMLSLPSYSKLRRRLIEEHQLLNVIELGSRVFPLQGGDKVNSILLTLKTKSKIQDNKKALFIDLKEASEKSDELETVLKQAPAFEMKNCYFHIPTHFLETNNFAFNYDFPPTLTKLISSWNTVGNTVDVRQGLATTDNKRFVQTWQNVEPNEIGTRWFPYVKGAGSERWFSPVLHVVEWENNGAEIKLAVQKKYPYLQGKTAWVVKNEDFYFKPGLCFSFVNTGRLAARRLPKGVIFDVAASALFVSDPDFEDFLLGYLNSAFLGAIAQSINPTVNFQVGDIKRLPLPKFSNSDIGKISELSRRCFSLKREISSVTNPGLPITFRGEDSPYSPKGANDLRSTSAELLSTEKEIDELVFQLACVPSAEREKIQSWIDKQTKRVPVKIS